VFDVRHRITCFNRVLMLVAMMLALVVVLPFAVP
jgi:hypothetical protein